MGRKKKQKVEFDPQQESRVRQRLILAEKSLQRLVERHGLQIDPVNKDITALVGQLLESGQLSRNERRLVESLRLARNRHAHKWNELDVRGREVIVGQLERGVTGLGFFNRWEWDVVVVAVGARGSERGAVSGGRDTPTSGGDASVSDDISSSAEDEYSPEDDSLLDGGDVEQQECCVIL